MINRFNLIIGSYGCGKQQRLETVVRAKNSKLLDRPSTIRRKYSEIVTESEQLSQEQRWIKCVGKK